MGTISISLGYDEDESSWPQMPGTDQTGWSTSAAIASDEDYGPWPRPPGVELPKPPEPSTLDYGWKILVSFLTGLIFACFPVFGLLILPLLPFWNDWGEMAAYTALVAIAIWFCASKVKDDAEHRRRIAEEHVQRKKEVEDQWNALVEEAEWGDDSKLPTNANGYVLDLPPEIELLGSPIFFRDERIAEQQPTTAKWTNLDNPLVANDENGQRVVVKCEYGDQHYAVVSCPADRTYYAYKYNGDDSLLSAYILDDSRPLAPETDGLSAEGYSRSRVEILCRISKVDIETTRFVDWNDRALEYLDYTYSAGGLNCDYCSLSGGDWSVAAADDEADAAAAGRKSRKANGEWNKTKRIDITKHHNASGVLCAAHVRMMTDTRNPLCPENCQFDFITAQFKLWRRLSGWTAAHIRGVGDDLDPVPGKWYDLEDAVDAVVSMRKHAEEAGARAPWIQIPN